MTGDMAGQVSAGAIPTTIRLRFLRQSRTDAIEREHSVRLELKQIFRGQILGALERPTEDPNSTQRYRVRPHHLLLECPDPRVLHLLFLRGHARNSRADGETGGRGRGKPEEVASRRVHGYEVCVESLGFASDLRGIILEPTSKTKTTTRWA